MTNRFHPHEYQGDALSFMLRREAAALFADPGMGKTAVTALSEDRQLEDICGTVTKGTKSADFTHQKTGSHVDSDNTIYLWAFQHASSNHLLSSDPHFLRWLKKKFDITFKLLDKP